MLYLSGVIRDFEILWNDALTRPWMDLKGMERLGSDKAKRILEKRLDEDIKEYKKTKPELAFIKAGRAQAEAALQRYYEELESLGYPKAHAARIWIALLLRNFLSTPRGNDGLEDL